MYHWGLPIRRKKYVGAAYETLLTWKNDRQVDILLLKALEKETRTNKQGVTLSAPLIAVLLASESADTRQELVKFLDVYTGTAKNGTGADAKIGAAPLAAIITVADELGKLGDQQSLLSLKRMTGLKCFSGNYAIRRAVVQAIILIHLPEAVQEQISLLSDVDGEIRGDILRHLAAVSGQSLGPTPRPGRPGGKRTRTGFRFPASDVSIPSVAAASPGTPTYYGLAIQARRIVFVIDISGSMEGPRILAAKRELCRPLTACPKTPLLASWFLAITPWYGSGV